MHAAAGLRRKAQVAGDHVQLPQSAAASEQGHAVSAGPAIRRGDRGGHARHRRYPGGCAVARHHRRVMASWAADQRGARVERDRPRPRARCGACPAREGRQAARGRHGPVGVVASRPWLELRKELPVGRLFCVVRGPTLGRACTSAGIRAQLHQTAAIAGVRRRFAPHQLRHAHAVEMSREGISLLVIQRQLGHADLAITSRYLRGIDNTEIIAAVYERPAPMVPADPRAAPRR
jgi:integrase